MAKLYRPPIPLSVKVAVARRQLIERGNAARVRFPTPATSLPLYKQLTFLLSVLSESMMCEVEELRLDHDPALGLRKRTGEGKTTVYDPPANDPNFMAYRPHGAQHAASHDVKTRIRGDHGQFSDVTLIKRERRRTRRPTERQQRIADLKDEQRRLRKELRRKLKKERGKPKGQGWRSRQLRGKKSPRRFGGKI